MSVTEILRRPVALLIVLLLALAVACGASATATPAATESSAAPTAAPVAENEDPATAVPTASITTTVRKKGTLITSSWRPAHALDSFEALPSAKRFQAKN